MNPDKLSALSPRDLPTAFWRAARSLAPPDVALLAAAVARRLSPENRFHAADEVVGLLAEVDERTSAAILYRLHRALRRAQVAEAARAFGLHLARRNEDPIPVGLRQEGWGWRHCGDSEAGLEAFRAAGPIGLSASAGGQCIAVAVEPLDTNKDPNTSFEESVDDLAMGIYVDLLYRSSAPDAGWCGTDYEVRPAPNGLWELSCRIPGLTRLLIVVPTECFPRSPASAVEGGRP